MYWLQRRFHNSETSTANRPEAAQERRTSRAKSLGYLSAQQKIHRKIRPQSKWKLKTARRGLSLIRDQEQDLKKTQARLNLGNVSTVAYRTGESDRAAALIATATLQDAGIVSKEDNSQVIDKSKLRREKEKRQRKYDLQKKNRA